MKREQEKVEELAEDMETEIIASLDYSSLVGEAEELGKTVMEAYPDSDMAVSYTHLDREGVVVTTMDGLMDHLLPLKYLREQSITVESGQVIDLAVWKAVSYTHLVALPKKSWLKSTFPSSVFGLLFKSMVVTWNISPAPSQSLPVIRGV